MLPLPDEQPATSAAGPGALVDGCSKTAADRSGSDGSSYRRGVLHRVLMAAPVFTGGAIASPRIYEPRCVRGTSRARTCSAST
jgi:hypothetical protein